MSESKKRPGEAKEIESFWAVLETDEAGDEGLAARVIPGFGALPYIFSTRSALNKILSEQEVGHLLGVSHTLRVVRFDRAKVVKVLKS